MLSTYSTARASSVSLSRQPDPRPFSLASSAIAGPSSSVCLPSSEPMAPRRSRLCHRRRLLADPLGKAGEGAVAVVQGVRELAEDLAAQVGDGGQEGGQLAGAVGQVPGQDGEVG